VMAIHFERPRSKSDSGYWSVVENHKTFWNNQLNLCCYFYFCVTSLYTITRYSFLYYVGTSFHARCVETLDAMEYHMDFNLRNHYQFCCENQNIL
jgi:hypothetical protein